ncbi:probable ubiquitin-conjugating enzyme E2 25 [Papaver somniferum]|uniref:probable ubiquitin-conjugating enzyme E2 25 n=1 Tax=Papaver somniferum TaxID=3469 RepID=UPI000E6F7C94|nr:probable ubiquitin-conjugating enzyme E2 25 [Papaver somniferum]
MATEFKQFDIISINEFNSISDHHYVSRSLSPSSTEAIMEEWRILEKDLPDSIFVRVYKGRVDLLRAVIIGPSGTPYHDGLFFFDIQVPSNYPALLEYVLASPPKVFSWNDDRSKKRNPPQSTILQVLVSIQGLVLNGEPFINFPGFESFANSSSWFKKRSVHENVFIKNCKTMVSILKKPPQSFEKFVSQHFRHRASTILVAFNAYINGQAEIGDPITVTAATEITASLASFTFKAEAGFVYPRLVDSFIKNGSSVESIELLDTSKTIREYTVHEHRNCQLVVLMIFILVFYSTILVKKSHGAGGLLYSLFGLDIFLLLLLIPSLHFEFN